MAGSSYVYRKRSTDPFCRESVQHNKYSARVELDGISICKGQRTRGRAVAFELFWQCFRCCTADNFEISAEKSCQSKRTVHRTQVSLKCPARAFDMILDEQSRAWEVQFEPGVERARAVQDIRVASCKKDLVMRSSDQSADHEKCNMRYRFTKPRHERCLMDSRSAMFGAMLHISCLSSWRPIVGMPNE